MPVLQLELTALFAVVFMSAILGLISRSILVAGGVATLVFGYLAINTNNSFFLGAWMLVLFLMALSTGRYMTQTLLGDTA